MKEFRSRPENQGMSQSEMMHYGSQEYKGGTEGGSLKSVMK